MVDFLDLGRGESALYSDLIGTNYAKNGRLPEGLDCYTLVQEIYKRRGIDLPSFDSPEEDNLINMIYTGEVDKYSVKLNEPEPFCMVSFSIMFPGVNHVGVVLEDCKRFIHILKHRNVAIERLDHRFWAQKIRGFQKWNKL